MFLQTTAIVHGFDSFQILNNLEISIVMLNMRHGTSTGATSLTMARDHQEHKIEQTMELYQHALTRTPAPEIKAYPSGRYLVLILVSLICVVFLVSLDMVCAQHRLKVSPR